MMPQVLSYVLERVQSGVINLETKVDDMTELYRYFSDQTLAAETSDASTVVMSRYYLANYGTVKADNSYYLAKGYH